MSAKTGEEKAMEYFIQLQDWIEKAPAGDFLKHFYNQEQKLFSPEIKKESAFIGFLEDYLKKTGAIPNAREIKCIKCGSDDIEDTVGPGPASGFHCLKCDHYFDGTDLIDSQFATERIPGVTVKDDGVEN